MANNYKKWDKAKRDKWNRYSSDYNKRHYKQYSVQLSTEKDADLIAFLDEHKPLNTLFKKMIRKEIEESKK